MRADSPGNDNTFNRSTAARNRIRCLVAATAAASAGALAVSTVTPTPTSLATVQTAAAVELAAFSNPLATLQQTLFSTFGNVSLLGTGIRGAAGSLAGALGNSSVLSEFANLLTTNAANPGAALEAVANAASYGGRVNTALTASNTLLQTALNAFPTIVRNSLRYLRTGQFVEAFSELNVYFLVSILERPGVPLFPLFNIPGAIAATIPGGQIVANVLDGILTRGIATGLTRALLVAPITATLFIAETLDHVRASVTAGNLQATLTELIAAPLGFVNAFVNGYVPDFPARSPFAGLLSPNGFFDYFLVDVPNAIAAALNRPVAPVAPAAVAALAAPTAAASTSPSALPPATGVDVLTIERMTTAPSGNEGAVPSAWSPTRVQTWSGPRAIGSWLDGPRGSGAG